MRGFGVCFEQPQVLVIGAETAKVSLFVARMDRSMA
jgi:hypothetical protein